MGVLSVADFISSLWNLLNFTWYSKTCKCGKKFGKYFKLARHLRHCKEKETRQKHLKVVYSDGIDEIHNLRKKNVTGAYDEDLNYQKTCFAAISPNWFRFYNKVVPYLNNVFL